jgi:6-phosphogluconolactonase
LYSFYAGCYTKDPQDRGIHLLHLDTGSGELCLEDSFYGGENPSFIVRSGNFLYAANETKTAGKVSALSVGDQGALAFLNSREASGTGTCHVATMNGFLYAANYASGGIFGVEILGDGSLGGLVAEIQHRGSGPNQQRQKGPHAHSVNPVRSPADGADFLIAADLGTDSLYCYQQQKDGSLDSAGFAVAPAGGGPRHLAFNGGYFYAVIEMGVSLACYKFTRTGPEQMAVYPLVEGSFTQADSAADIHITADGARLYASVRGKNLISAFEIKNDGSLRFVGSYPTFGDSPRNFCFSPGEEFVVIAHQVSGNITVCPVNSKTGAVEKALCSAVVPGASCVINA